MKMGPYFPVLDGIGSNTECAFNKNALLPFNSISDPHSSCRHTHTHQPFRVYPLLPDAPTATPHTELMEIGIPHAFRCIPQKTWKKTLLEYSGLVKYHKAHFKIRRDTAVPCSVKVPGESRAPSPKFPGGALWEIRKVKKNPQQRENHPDNYS